MGHHGHAGERQRPGLPANIGEWDEEQTRTICLWVVAYLKTQPKYAGQFDHLAEEIRAAVDQSKLEKPATLGVNVADLRKALVTKLQALIHKQTGRAAETPS